MSLAPPSLRRRRLPQLLGIGLSAAALAGLVHLESVWAHADVAQDDAAELDEADGWDVEEDELDPALAENSAGSAASDEPAVAAAAAVSPEPEAPIVIAEGLGCDGGGHGGGRRRDGGRARAPGAGPRGRPRLEGHEHPPRLATQLKALGLKISVRDSYNERLPRDIWSEFKVRRQKIEAGTEVTPGTRVRVKARYRSRGYAQGY